MAGDVEALLHDLLVFLQRLQPQHLPDDAQAVHQALVTRLQQRGTASKPVYLDMNGARRTQLRVSDLLRLAAKPDVDDVDAPSGGAVERVDSSASCSDGQDDFADDWPPRKAPSCIRPDLSPDWGLSAAAAVALAVHSGSVYRGGPCRWFRRRGWAVLLPGRLLVFAGASASRPRLVLLLSRGLTAATCCAACCAVYTARPRPEGLAFELCCPGRKTHQLWVTDPEETKRWLDALRAASDGEAAAGAEGCSPRPLSAAVPSSASSLSSSAGGGRAASDLETGPGPRGSGSGSEHSGGGGEQRMSAALSQASVTSIPTVPVPVLGQLPPSRSLQRLPSLPGLVCASDPPEQQQQQYESMLSGSEEIYHDIAPPQKEGPSYANIPNVKSDSNAIPSTDHLDTETRPLYDDVAVLPKTPEYCNLMPDNSKFEHVKEDENNLTEHLYDDIGSSEQRTSVYELIQDPMINQRIRCS